MNHGSNHTLLEMDTNAKVNDPIAPLKRERRRRVAGPQSGEESGLYSNAISRFVHVRGIEVTASIVIAFMVGGGLASALILA